MSNALFGTREERKKITLVGPSGVGKTSLLYRICYGQFEEVIPTMGCSYINKNIQGIDNNPYELDFWDTAGQEKYSSIIPLYFKNNWLYWLVFDLSDEDSISDLYAHVLNINYHEDVKKLDVYLIGNKKDLLTIPFKKDGFKMQSLFNSFSSCKYFEVSAKTGENVDLLFSELCKDVCIFKEDFVLVNKQGLEEKKEKERCCK